MNWLSNFLNGRNGNDQLSLALSVLSIFILLIGNVTKQSFISLIAFLPIFLMLFRTFSKNVEKRRLENYKFMIKVSPIYSWIRKTAIKFRDFKTHKYLKCPNCKATLRVPKGKGKIFITCPKCKNGFNKKT